MKPASMRKKKAAVDPTGSLYTKICRGCRLCQKGAKMVLFVTGDCGRDCFYCPLSVERKGYDHAYANERLITTDDDVLAEAKRMGALGTGITGGEPLGKLERTLHYIELLKANFGEKHHIHLYTGIAAMDTVLKKLREAGLDEIRFHPPVEDWDRFKETGFYRALKRSMELGMDAGVEIPAIKPVPDIVEAIHEAGGFLNLNELEFSDTNCEALKERGYGFDNDTSNAARGSQEIGHQIVLNILANTRTKDCKNHSQYFTKGFEDKCLKTQKTSIDHKNIKIRTRYCSSRFKDAVQLRERLKRMARNTARPFDEISDDGTIIYAEIHGNITDALRIIKSLKVPRRWYRSYDGRIDIAWWVLADMKSRRMLEDIKKIPGSQCSIVERYPMENGLVVERIPL